MEAYLRAIDQKLSDDMSKDCRSKEANALWSGRGGLGRTI